MIINPRIPLFFALLALLLPACNNNNNNEEPVIKKDDTPVQEKEMKEAIAKYPDSVPLLEKLIEYYDNNDNIDQAIATINVALARDSNNVKLWDRKAILYIEKKDTAKAIQAYENAINIYPNPEYVMTLGLLYAFTRNPGALSIADGLLMADKAKAEKEAYIIKGIYSSNINQKEKAITYFDNCLKLSYNYIPAYLQKAITLYEMGNYGDALLVLDKALALQSNFDEGYYWMGRCFEKLNRTNDAIESYRSAILYNPDYIEAKEALAKLGVK